MFLSCPYDPFFISIHNSNYDFRFHNILVLGSITKPKIISRNAPSSTLPPPTLQDNDFKSPSQPLIFGTFPDWIKTKNIGTFSQGRTVRLNREEGGSIPGN
jgi:hypothetical protein